MWSSRSLPVVLMLAAVIAAVGLSACSGTAWCPIGARVPVLLLASLPVLFVGISAHGRIGWTLAAWGLVFLTQIAAMLATADGALAGDRERVAATVLADTGVDGKGGPHLYALAGPDGRRLDGTLRTEVPHRPGDRVEVLVDRSGWYHPTTPDAASEAVSVGVGAAPIGCAALALALVAVRPQRREGSARARWLGPPPTDAELARRLVVEFRRARPDAPGPQDPDEYLAALDPVADRDAFDALVAWIHTSGPVATGGWTEDRARLRAVTDGIPALFRWRAARF
ncbi:hypothetical protein R8Z50_27045 [Longispora sp. K20-0274]|uniref:hypothetical protein n=1 Tax=Longispora sp. K20-0274 TaxID=3088255 RepID=UPI00399ADC58